MRDDEETRRAVSRLTPARVGLMADEAARAYGIDPVVARRALLTAQALITIPVRALPDGDDLASGIVGAFSRCPLLDAVPESARWAMVGDLLRGAWIPADP